MAALTNFWIYTVSIAGLGCKRGNSWGRPLQAARDEQPGTGGLYNRRRQQSVLLFERCLIAIHRSLDTLYWGTEASGWLTLITGFKHSLNKWFSYLIMLTATIAYLTCPEEWGICELRNRKMAKANPLALARRRRDLWTALKELSQPVLLRVTDVHSIKHRSLILRDDK